LAGGRIIDLKVAISGLSTRPCGRIELSNVQVDSQISASMIHGGSASGGATMLTGMTEDDWAMVLQVFAASCSQRGAKGRNDRRFFEALHYFTVHNITWRRGIVNLTG
jgi:hypothetical protein